VEAARAKYPDLRFVRGDATDFALPERFDAVFSNATLHWVTDADASVGCVARALKPGGRFVAEFGGKNNIAGIVASVRRAAREISGAGLPHPWYYPSVGEYAPVLERHGLEVTAAWLFDRPTPLEGADGFRAWLAMFGGDWLAPVPADRKPRLLERAEEL